MLFEKFRYSNTWVLTESQQVDQAKKKRKLQLYIKYYQFINTNIRKINQDS